MTYDTSIPTAPPIPTAVRMGVRFSGSESATRTDGTLATRQVVTGDLINVSQEGAN